MRSYIVILLTAICIPAFSQTIPEKFEDGIWAHFNSNINIFMTDGIGNAFKRDLDPYYVDDKLLINHYAFHNLDGMLMESFSYVDLGNESNSHLYNMKFENGETANFSEVIEYIADKYTGYYLDKNLHNSLYKAKVDSIKEVYQIKESRRFVFQEFWYYDKETGEMESYLRGIGLAPKESKDFKYVLWIDMRYFDPEVLKRIRIMEGDSVKHSFLGYLQSHPFAIDKLDRGYSRYFDQTKYDLFNNEMDAYFELFMQRNQIRLDRSSMKTKKGITRSKMIQGVLKNNQPQGVWTLKYPNGKKRTEFTFKNGIAQGAYKLYDEQGNLIEEGELQNNLKHNKCIAYYASGAIKSSKRYDLGTASGTHELLFENGKTHSKFSFENGKIQGEFVQYNADESIYLKGNMVDGVVEGLWDYNLPINSIMCGYLKDEIPHLGDVRGLDPNCMDDCMATFQYKFVHEKQSYCMNGLCVHPRRHTDIK